MAQLTTEQELLGAELLCGYKYFKAQTQITQALQNDTTQYNTLQNQRKVALTNFPRTGDLSQITQVRNIYNAYKVLHESTDYEKYQKEQIATRKKYAKDMLREFTNAILFFLLLAISLFLCIYGFVNGTGSSGSLFWGFVGSVSLVIYIVLAVLLANNHFPYCCWGFDIDEGGYTITLVICFGIFLYFYGTVVSLIKYLIAHKRSKKTNYRKEYDLTHKLLTLEEFIEKRLDQKDRDYFYQQLHQTEIDQNVARCDRLIERQKLVLTNTRNHIEKLNAEGQQIIQDLEIIPQYYFTKDSIERMLFFFVNKRADTIKDLINLHEQTLFQEELIKGINNLSVSINKLTQAVNDGFTRLGAQLGVINNSIMENTRQMQVNKQKLDTVQDKMARNYLNIVHRIHNVEQIVQEHGDYTIEDVGGQLVLKRK